MLFNEIENTIERLDCTIHYWISGNRKKPLIFFAHGAAVDHTQFDLQMSLLQENYHVVRWDMRGHGKSRPLEGHFSIKDAADDLLHILDGMNIDQAILIGQSAGTYVIQEFAFQHPERVKAMIVIDGTHITAKLTLIESLALKMSPLLFRLWPYENLKKSMADASSIKTGTKQYLKEKFNKLSKKEFINIWEGISTCIHYESEYHVTSSLLLIYGKYDKTGNIKKSMQEWAERDKSKYVIIPDAGHGSNQDNPEFFNKVMIEFLDGIN